MKATSSRASTQILLLLLFSTPLGLNIALADSPTKLGDIVTTANSGTAPTSGYYYVTLRATPDSGVALPTNTCVDQSFWSFVKRFFGATPSSAAAILTVKVTPASNPAQAITVPVYSTTAGTLNSNGVGTNCQTAFEARPLTFTFNSSQNPTFSIEMAFHLANNNTSNVVTTVLTDAKTLMSLMSAGSTTPAALAVLGNPEIDKLAGSIDSAVRNNWTNSNDLQFSTVLDPGGSGGRVVDQITFKMPPLASSGGGSKVGKTWNPAGVLSLEYSKERFKSLGQWQDYSTVMTTTVVPSTTAGAQTNLYAIVLNGTATGGFKLGALNSASTVDSLNDACENLKRFLASFLIPDDALVARFAVLKGSPYEKLPALRATSSCFNEDELTELKKYRSDYGFSAQPREDPLARKLKDKMLPVRVALRLQNPALITRAIADPPTNFYIALSKNASDYFHGQAAIDKLTQTQVLISCYHARPGNDLSSIAVLATLNGTTTAGIVSFDDKNLFASLVLMPPDDAVALTGITKSDWLAVTQPTPVCATVAESDAKK